MAGIPEYVKNEARIELARRYFWDFEKLLYPELFTEERKLLKDMAETLQWFVDESDKHFLVMSVPPGHYKSFTGKNFGMFLMGRDPLTRIIGVANSGDLASMFSTQIRDTILGLNVGKGGVPYPKIFPNTRIKMGFATKSKWELEGSAEPSYRSVSPGSAVTGSRADVFLIDDIIKGYLQSLNADELRKHFEFYKNTLYSRTDGENYKFIIIMQRWATNDLAGEIIKLYGDDVVQISHKIEENGKMLEPSIMSRKKFEEAKRTLDPHVLKANYFQQPVDVKGRLYKEFKTYVRSELPSTATVKKNYTDTADKGTDFLCSLNWELHGEMVYITDVYFSDEAMEETEPEVARMVYKGEINEATVESNNGGRGFGRNVKRIIKETYNSIKTVFIEKNQTSNKEARILSSSAWVQEHVLMPEGWANDHPEFYAQLMSYQRKGKNPHDDAPDVLAGIYEEVTGGNEVELGFF